MTSRLLSLLLALVSLTNLSAIAQTSGLKEPELFKPQNVVVNHKIATLKSPVDRHVAEG